MRKAGPAPAVVALVGIVAGVTLCLSSVAGASSTSTGSASKSRSGTTQTLFAKSVALVKKKFSVHLVLTIHDPTSTEVITANSANKKWTQSVLITQDGEKGHFFARLVDQMVYLRGDSAGLDAYLNVPNEIAPHLANEWLSVTKNQKTYATRAKSASFSGLAQNLLIPSGVTVDRRATIDRKSAIRVTGTSANLFGKGKAGNETLYLPSAGPALPIQLVLSGTITGKKVSEQFAFSGWNEQFNVAKPSGAHTLMKAYAAATKISQETPG